MLRHSRERGGAGSELWVSDGTSAGTEIVRDLCPGPCGVNPALVGAIVKVMLWSADLGLFRRQLWRSDGTRPGTFLLTGPEIGLQAAAPRLFRRSFYFSGCSGFGAARDCDLWRTDGTAAGTRLFHEAPRSIRWLFVAGDRLYYLEEGGGPGTEPLGHGRHPRRNGPAAPLLQGDHLPARAGRGRRPALAGTRLVQDVAPQAASSAPEQLTAAGDKLFFTADDGVTGREVWVLPLSGPASCRPSSTRLCLGGGRYAVEAAWRDFQGNRGVGRAVPLTADTGYFWFFDPANVEVVLKVLDGRGLNGHVWVFYGALSTVEYTLTVTDTETGLARRYLNPSGQLASVADTRAFGPLGASAQAVAASVAPPSPPALVERRVVAAAATGSCAPSSTRLCLEGGRFAVEIAWQDFQGNTGMGQAVELTADTGWFWFFDPANVEVVLKVLDGTPLNGHHWVFYGALSSVEYTVTVTDTQTGERRTYRIPSGRLASVADTGAF